MRSGQLIRERVSPRRSDEVDHRSLHRLLVDEPVENVGFRWITKIKLWTAWGWAKYFQIGRPNPLRGARGGRRNTPSPSDENTIEGDLEAAEIGSRTTS